MITVLHGDDVRKSREELFLIKQDVKGKEIRELEGKSISDTELVQALSSSSMFGGDTLVIIELLFSGLGKKLKRIEELATIIKDNSSTVDVILWENKELGKTAISSLGKGIANRIFKLPVIIFQFLDSVGPNNSRSLIQLYDQVVNDEPPDLVHALLVKRVRQLLLLKSGKTPDAQQAWQLTRLTNQCRPFTLERLLTFYKNLKTIEYNRNSGQGVFALKEATELLLLSL